MHPFSGSGLTLERLGKSRRKVAAMRLEWSGPVRSPVPSIGSAAPLSLENVLRDTSRTGGRAHDCSGTLLMWW